MLRAVFIVAVAAVVAAFLVPLHGKTLWERVERHAFPYAVRSLRGTPSKPKKTAVAPAVQGRRDRIVPEKPKEKLSDGDRAALDRLVSTRAR